MSGRVKLDKGEIVETARAMINAHGGGGFSMRKLAAALNVDPMAIYHHHANKAALMHAVIQSMLEQLNLPEPSGEWQRDVRAVCSALRVVALRNPGVFVIYETYDEWLPGEHRLHEAFHAPLLQAGFSPRLAVQSVRVFLTYVEAFAYDEIEDWLAIGSQDELLDSLKQGDFPAMQSLIDELACADADENFEFGLTVLIEGVEQARRRG